MVNKNDNMVNKNENNRRNGGQGQAGQSENAQEGPRYPNRSQGHFQGQGGNQGRGGSGEQQERPQHPNRGQGQRQNQGGPNAGQTQGGGQFQNRNHDQGVKNPNEKPEGSRPREGGQNRGYYRDRDNQQRQHSQTQGPRFSTRNRAEETIDDIKEDIVRIEKEIELEIKEIRSLKL